MTGLQEGFYQDWDATTNMLTIATDEAERLLQDAIWTVKAKETETSTPVTSKIEYEVVPAAPIIDEVGEQPVYKGVFTDIFVQINNRPTQVTVDGLLMGLKSDNASEEDPDNADETVDGVRISGTLPDAANLTVDRGNFAIAASTDGGNDTYSLPFVISDGSSAYLVENGSNKLYRVRLDEALLWEYDLPSGSYIRSDDFDAFLVDSEGNAYVFDNTGDNWYSVGSGGGMRWTYEAPAGNYRAGVDSAGNFYLIGRELGVLRKIGSDGTETTLYSAPTTGGTESYAMTVAPDGSIYLANNRIADIYKINADGSLAWTYDSPASFYRMQAAADSDLYLMAQHGVLRKVNKSNGSVRWTYTAPTGNQYVDRSFVVGSDGSVYIFNNTTQDVYKVSSSGSLLWTYAGAPSGAYPAGVTIDKDDNVYLFKNSGNPRALYKISSAGTLLWTYEAGNSGAFGYTIGVGFDDSVYIFNYSSDTLSRINSDGTLAWANTDLSGTFTHLLAL